MSLQKKTFQPLFKRTTGGGEQIWEVWVEPIDTGGRICIRFGLVGGKLQDLREDITVGKNVGKRNETSAFEQACTEAESRWNKQLTRRGYGLTVDASAAVRSEAPMLAHDYTKHIKSVLWDAAYGQPKLDGFRCLAKCRGGKVLLWSREGKPIETMGHIVEQLQAVMQEGDTLDGELYIHGVNFQKIASLVKKQQDDSVKVQYHVYDAMLEAPFIDRYQYAQKQLRRLPSGIIVPVSTLIVPDLTKLMEFQAACIADGFEGAMLRHGTEDYDAGKRSKYLLKVKTFQDAEFLITGAREGRGTHAGMAIFMCKTAAGTEFEALAHGTHDEKRAAWTNREQHIGKMLTVKFQEWTDDPVAPVPRFPVALRFAATAMTTS